MPGTPTTPIDLPADARERQRHYLRFYAPLTLIGLIDISGQLAKQGALLSVGEHGVRELVAFTLALAIMNPLVNLLIMVPQMSNVLGRTAAGYQAARAFMLRLSALLTGIILLLALSGAGSWISRSAFAADDELVSAILFYLLWLSPRPIFNAVGQFAIGTLVRARRTGLVTMIRVVDTSMVFAMLSLGIAAGWDIRVTMIAAGLTPLLAGALIAVILARRLTPTPQPDDDVAPTTAGIVRYFGPMAFTTAMFALSRPTLFALISLAYGPGAFTETIIAGLALAFSSVMLFHNPINGYRHVMTTFGDLDPEGVHRFIRRTTLCLVLAMCLTLASPLFPWFLEDVMGATGTVRDVAQQTAWVLVLMLPTIAWRNWYHGLSMVHKRTGAMLLGSVGRYATVLIVGGLLMFAGVLDHRFAALVLTLAFAAEAVGTKLGSQRWRAELGLTGRMARS